MGTHGRSANQSNRGPVMNGNRRSTLPAGSTGPLVIHRAGFGDVTLQRPPDEVLGEARALDQPRVVHARLDPHLVQHVHQVLGGDVSGGALRVGAAAQAAHGTVEDGHARLEAGQEIVPA